MCAQTQPSDTTTELLQQAMAGIVRAVLRDELEAALAHRQAEDDLGVFSIKEAIGLLGIGRTTIYRLMDVGELPYVKIGPRRFIPKGALRELLGGVDHGPPAHPGRTPAPADRYST